MNDKIKQLLEQGMEKHNQGFFNEAEMFYRKVLEYSPEQPDAIHFIGVLATNVGKLDIAKQYLNRAIELFPGNAACYNNLGNVWQLEKNFNKAIEYYKKALKYDASHHMALNNLGAACIRLGENKKAERYLKKALDLAPDYAGAHNNLGEAYSYTGQYEKAFACYERAVSLEPHMVDAHWNRALSWLLRGKLEKGFAEYEWRWQRQETPKRDIDPSKRWQGEPLKDKSVFVYEEQGIGDTLQFVRYLPMLKALGARVIFEASPVLVRLFDKDVHIDKLWVRNTRQSTRQIDHYDYHCPILSLPAIFKTNLDTIPSTVPYMQIESHMKASWKNRLPQTPGYKIGIVWAGNPDHRNDHNRSCLLSQFKILKTLPDVELIGLQKDKYEKWTDIDPLSIVQKDFGDDLHDFADTAALIDNLDLIICVDTAIVHLAGAMGKNVWVLLPFSPDWRWMLDRKDSPWYPSMTLFRQKQTGGWKPVFSKIAEKLTALIKKRSL